jgi:hypothetical protein
MIFTIFSWIGMVIVLLISILLIVPVRFFVAGFVDDREGLDYRIIADWAFGLVSFRAVSGRPAALYITGLHVCQISLIYGKKRQKQKKPGKKKSSPLKWFRWARRNLPPLNRILSSFARAALLKGFISAKIGLPDPADTAIVGIIGGPMQIETRHFYMSLTTVYDYEIVQIRSQAQSALIVGWFGLVMIGLLLEGQVRKMHRNIKQTQYKEASL